MSLFIAAITLGFLGSFHCVGMCGPIALALPLNSHTVFSKISGAIVYNSGRIITYALMGAFFGLVGESFVIAGYQQTLSIAIGVALLIMVLLPNHWFSQMKIMSLIYKATAKLKMQLGRLFHKSSYPSLFFIGTLNGLLPCGLVYLGIAGSIATGNSMNGSVFMAVFGLGTLPAMLAVSLFSSSIGFEVRNKIRKVVPVFVAATALLLILRGMNLGIPYLSPEISGKTIVQETCCHK